MPTHQYVSSSSLPEALPECATGKKSRPTVSIICAPPNGRNPGMASVDLAAKSVLNGLGPVATTYWRLWDQSEWQGVAGGSHITSDGRFYDPDTGLTYEPLRHRIDEALKSDLLIYWGDFHHLAAYQRDAARILGTSLGIENPNEFVSRHLLLKHQSTPTLARVFSYGTTLGHNAPLDYAGTYGVDLANFLARSRQVWLRDPYSATIAQQARTHNPASCFGVDAAFLLPAANLLPNDGSLGVYVGRSALRPEAVALFGRAFAKHMQLRPEWIDWGREPAFWPMGSRSRFRLAWPGLEHGRVNPRPTQRMRIYGEVLAGSRHDAEPVAQPPAPELLRQLSRHEVILTDTYHLAVNAWRVGTPAICIVDTPTRVWSVNSGEPGNSRDKRRALYSMIEALPLLVDGPSLFGCANSAAARIGELVSDSRTLDVVDNRIRGLIVSSRERFTRELHQVLGGAPRMSGVV